MARTIALIILPALLATGLIPKLSTASEATDQADNAAAVVAVNVPDVSDPYQVDEPSPAADINRLLTLYMDARSTGMLDEAEYIAKQIVEMSIEAYGLDSKQTAESLVDLGTVQTANDDFEAAVLNLASAIAILERVDNRLSMDLIRPLNAMGTAQLQTGNVDVAMASWNRAVHISHVNLGPHNIEQVEALISIGRVYTDLDKSKKARKIRRRIAYLEQRLALGEIPVSVAPEAKP